MDMKKVILPLAAVALLVTGCENSGCDNVDASSSAAPGTPGDFKANVKDRIFFGFAKSDVTPAAAKVLELQAAWLKTHSSTSATIDAHTDVRGTADYNMALSIARANSTKKALSGMGVEASRLTAKGQGKDQPIVPNATTEEQHAQNRVAITSING